MHHPARTLPIAIACERRLREEIERHVEAVLGWQVVDVDDGFVRPVAVLADGSIALGRGPAARGAVPTILVVDGGGAEAGAGAGGDGHVGAASARAAISLGAVGAVTWPQDRERLPEVVESLAGMSVADATTSVHVCGGSGGVGTTTIALALAGLWAWDGHQVLAVTTGDTPAPAVPVIADDSLDGPGVWNAAARIPGVPGLRVATRGLAPARSAPAIEVPDGVRVIADLGVAPDLADVLVVRRDRCGADAVLATAAGVIVLLDEGIVPEAEVLAGAAGRVVVVLPRWARVGRASATRRVPAGLPGSWLAPLRGLLDT